MELRCQLRFADAPGGSRAILDATDAKRTVTLTLEATGADQGEALALLAERTRELYGAVCGVVDTVEELTRAYFSGEERD